MWHVTCMQGNQSDSRLLVVANQIGHLIPGLSFGHNLCFKYPNGWCEPILDIYVSRAFQWYKKLFNPMNFDSCNFPLKIRESIGTLTPKMGAHLGVWGFIPSHSLALSWEHEMWLSGSLLHLHKPLPWSRAQGYVCDIGVPACPFILKMLWIRERTSTPSSTIFTFRFAFESFKECGGASFPTCCWNNVGGQPHLINIMNSRRGENSGLTISLSQMWWPTIFKIEISCDQWEGSACPHDGPYFFLKGWGVVGIFCFFSLFPMCFHQVPLIFKLFLNAFPLTP